MEGTGMSDEERQKLCDWLRHLPAYLSEDGMQAADEFERLAAALAQSDAEPVAWQCRSERFGLEWTFCAKWQYDDPQESYEYRALYTAPPRPDASAKDVATKIASRPALAKLIDTGALQFSEMCDLRDDIEKELRSRSDASVGPIEAAEFLEAEPHYRGVMKIASRVLRSVARSRAADRSGK
jgi:hypothetical protein